ncbi:hypothetical protein SAMN04487977_101514 [Treponema bryantii]|uniref:Uncharacterized protein n=1 Tax=Treponema bryantii TaxID=163 RepID=A0A1H9AYM7_9SPIR|nr:hypothetical protein [Treponema bryantii]SEP81709.1 hypothetical protein SAMN04487977_101514 [Treponema bryantii]
MSCKYNNCKHCGYKSECEIYKENAELEEKISVLLSCKNCPENKGGFICQKEYENKCLTQKIQYIKELQEENAGLRARLNAINLLTPELQKASNLKTQQLTKAKEIIKEFVKWANWQGNSKCPSFKSIQDKAEQFLKDSEVEK